MGYCILNLSRTQLAIEIRDVVSPASYKHAYCAYKMNLLLEPSPEIPNDGNSLVISMHPLKPRMNERSFLA